MKKIARSTPLPAPSSFRQAAAPSSALISSSARPSPLTSLLTISTCCLLASTACSGSDDPMLYSSPSGGASQQGASGGNASGGGDAMASGGSSSGGAGGGSNSGGTASGGGDIGGDTGSGGGSGGDDGSGCTANGFYVDGTKVYDSNCNLFVPRGVNDPYVWYKWDSSDYPLPEQRFMDIASVGANSVRVVLSAGNHGEGWEKVSGAEVADIISWCKANQLIAMLEVHDSTGYPEKQGAADPMDTLDYWLSDEIKNVIMGEEAFVMINIANEAFGNSMVKATDAKTWVDFHVAAVPALRAAGLNHLLVVDAPNWGQDYQWIMRDGPETQQIFDADPNKNTVFSVHMYDVYGQASVVQQYFDKFLARGLPLFVGEFAADHGPDKNVDEATILALSEQHDIGYLGWSWDGNSADLSSLDIVDNWNPATLSPWGTALIEAANGIKTTSDTCTCFD